MNNKGRCRLRITAIAFGIALCLIQVSCAASKSPPKSKPKTPATSSKSTAKSSKAKPAPNKTQAQKPKTDPKKAPAKPAPKTLPKLVDLGATKCIPCKMMAPILEELKKEYKGSLEVVFIDVWENRDAAQKHRVQSIPTQIFYDAKGKEFARHVGFLAKEDILKTFEKQGIKLVKFSPPKKEENKK